MFQLNSILKRKTKDRKENYICEICERKLEKWEVSYPLLYNRESGRSLFDLKCCVCCCSLLNKEGERLGKLKRLKEFKESELCVQKFLLNRRARK